MKRAASDIVADSTASAKYQATPLFSNRSVEVWQKLGLGCLSALPSSALEATWCFLSTGDTVRLRYYIYYCTDRDLHSVHCICLQQLIFGLLCVYIPRQLSKGIRDAMPNLITILSTQRCDDGCEHELDWRLLPWKFLSNLTHLKELRLRGNDSAIFMLLILYGKLPQLHKVKLAFLSLL
jgi:hypothetical protein